MTLDEAIAEVKRVTPPRDPWSADDFRDGPHDPDTPIQRAIAVILNTVASGELVKAGWQPIETAPRDGTKIDLWMVDQDGRAWREADAYYVTQRDDGVFEYAPELGFVRTGYAARDGWWAPNHDHDGQDGWCDEPEYFNPAREKVAFTLPTHWMPRPQPPEVTP